MALKQRWVNNEFSFVGELFLVETKQTLLHNLCIYISTTGIESSLYFLQTQFSVLRE